MPIRRILAPLSALLLALPLIAGAATFTAGETLSLPTGDAPHEGNVYAAGGTVAVAEDVNGDLLLAGGNVTTTGTVSNDLAAVGGDVTLVGDVGEDLRAAGGSVTVTGTVGGDAVLAGGFVHVLPDAVISGDVTIAAGEVMFEGRAEGNVSITADKVTFAGAAGDVAVRTTDLHVTDAAAIDGTLAYRAPKEGTFADGASVAGVDYVRTEGPVRRRAGNGDADLWIVFAAFFGALVLVKLVTLLTLGLVAVIRFRKTTDALLADARKAFWTQLLLGLAITVVTPIAMLLLFSTVIGMGFAFIVGALFVPLCAFAGVLAPVGFGNWLLSFGAKAHRRTHDWKALLLGYAVLTPLVILLPPIGVPFTFAWYFAVLGETARRAWRKLGTMS